MNGTTIDSLVASSDEELLALLRDENSPLHQKFNELVYDVCGLRPTVTEKAPVHEFRFNPMRNMVDLKTRFGDYIDITEHIVLVVDSQQLGLVMTKNSMPLPGYLALEPHQFLRHITFDGTMLSVERLRRVIVGLEELKKQFGG